MLGLGEIFTLFFVTLGPLKVLGPFAQRTHGIDDAAVRKIAVMAFAIATIAVVIGAFVGRSLLEHWNISVGAMTLAAGIIFFLVAIRQNLEEYEPPHKGEQPPLPERPLQAAMRLVFPIVLTPYGVAAVIALMAASGEAQRTEMIIVLLVGVMVLNLIAMIFAQKIMVGIWIVVLQLLGAVLGVLQVALSIQVMIVGLQLLKIIGT